MPPNEQPPLVRGAELLKVLGSPVRLGVILELEEHGERCVHELVASLDVSRLDDEDFSLVRAFLLRVDRLDPADRLRLATELAEGVRRRIDQPVSAPVTAEVWLVCVASAYQSRRGNLLADAALGLAPIAAPIAAPIRSR